jgi:hypothetical protein
MMAYEFYWRDGIGEVHLVGILPERRKNRKRITQESIMNFGRMLIGDNVVSENIYFIRVALDDSTGEIRLTNASLMT